jgi:hypothetical protein
VIISLLLVCFRLVIPFPLNRPKLNIKNAYLHSIKPKSNMTNAYLQIIPPPYKIILVTFAHYEPFITSQQMIIKTQQNRSVDFIEAWGWDKLVSKFPQYNSQWNFPGTHGRLSCVLFKPVLMTDAMSRANDGDWIIWTDSSRYFVNGIQESMREFIAKLESLHLNSFPGVALCGLTNVDNRCVSTKTFRDMNVDIPRYWFAPHFQNNFIAFKKTDQNWAFLKEWSEYMIDMDVACGSGADDQSLFSILVSKYNLKFLNMCNFETHLNNPDYQSLKNIDFIIKMVSLMNESSVIHTQDDLMLMWRKLQWSPAQGNFDVISEYYPHRHFGLPTH